jgi:FkbM family methyltransferase
MELAYRIKRAAKELLGRPQWPRTGIVRPRNFEEQIYRAAVEEGDVCFDVGANVGEVAVLLARLATRRGLVVAFEPVFSVYSILCQRVQDDPYSKARILALPVGLSDAVGPRTISTPDGNSGLASLASSAVWQGVHGATVSTQICDFSTIDAILADGRYSTRPDFIKIDVEGAELLVLRGGSDAFSRGFRPLMLIELFAPWQHAFGYGPWDVLGFLTDLGYRFFFACPEGLVGHVPSPSQPFPVQYERGYNVVAYLPEEHARRVERLDRLTIGAGGILPMPPPPVANKIAPDQRPGN